VITKIEQAMVDRLRRGLGRMVRTVKSYNGEVDDLAAQIMTLPAVWVTYGGSRIDSKATGSQRYQDKATFVVMCATRLLRNEIAGRQGGVDKREIGNNDLIRAVRRLLDGQRLGLADSRGLIPQAVNVIVNNTLVQAAALSVYAIEYVIYFDSIPLENNRFPEAQTDPNHPDYIFTQYQGELSAPYADFAYLDGIIFDPNNQANVPIKMKVKDE
jgi:Mu-like prophage protein gp37